MTGALDLLSGGIDVTRPVMVSLVHASAPAELAELRVRVEAMFNVRELSEHQMGPAVTCHTGPGAVGAAVLQPTEEELELIG